MIKETTSLLTVAQVAKILNLHRCTVLELIKDGKLRAFVFGKRTYRIKEDDLNAFIEQSVIIFRKNCRRPLYMFSGVCYGQHEQDNIIKEQ